MNSASLTTPSTAAASVPDSLTDGDASDTYSKLLGERMRDVAQEATAHAMADSSSDASKNGVAPTAPAQPDQGNMAELLEAAAKATSESQRWNNAAGHGLRKVAGHANLRGSALEEDGHNVAGLKRKRTPDATRDGDEDAGGGDDYSTGAPPSPSKRTKVAPFAEGQPHANTPAAQSAMSIDTPSPQHNVAAQSAQMQSLGMTDVRAAVGVHSAAALFRQTPTDSRKKYTRPPMHKLFSDLQLTPENFVRLQACAKTYMLDDSHPERQECVGNRGKGDADMVKLRLFNCARDFLNGGVGERFFGPYVPTPTEYDTIDGKPVAPDRKWIWPRDANKIVSLVTPLLRRMVTNERQRQYAQETRKGGSKKQDTTLRDNSQEASSEQLGASMGTVDQRPLSQPPLDPSLNPHHQSSLLAHSSPYQSPQKAHQPRPQENYPQLFQIPQANSQSFITSTSESSSTRPMSPSVARQTLSPRGQSSPQPSPHMSTASSTQQQHPAPPTPAAPPRPTSTVPGTPFVGPPPPTATATTTTSYPPPRPSENVIQILITRSNIKLAPRIDLPSFPSTPHHTMPLAQLRDIVGEEVRALVRSGVVPGLEQQQQGEGRDAEAAAAAVGEGGAGENNGELHVDSHANGGTIITTAPTLQPQQQQQHDHHHHHHHHHDTAPPSTAATATTSPSSSPLKAPTNPVVLPPRYELRALTGRGLQLVETERDWQGVLAEVANAVWMEGAVRVVAEVLAG
ncbi:hypothetical protein IWZ03DRAFT_381523 [Phyllosticta citriasiana]|uniref:Uncharacterized protein n=1 Tax=Phyllosticta citriasiana TaxID=595635 RepID=A0ABR1KJJ0_9PEZI